MVTLQESADTTHLDHLILMISIIRKNTGDPSFTLQWFNAASKYHTDRAILLKQKQMATKHPTTLLILLNIAICH